MGNFLKILKHTLHDCTLIQYDEATPVRNTLPEREEESWRGYVIATHTANDHYQETLPVLQHHSHKPVVCILVPDSASNKLEKTIPIYSVPDMKKKREAHQEKKEPNDRETSMKP